MMSASHHNPEPLDQDECGHMFYLVILEAEEDPTERAQALRCANCGYTRPVPEAATMEFYGMGACSSCERSYAIYTPRDATADCVRLSGSLCPSCARKGSKR